MLNIDRVAHGYAEKTVLQDISLSLGPGERLGLVGANGSGKSTLLRLIAGTESPRQGHIVRPQVAMFEPQRGPAETTLLQAVMPARLAQAAHELSSALAALEADQGQLAQFAAAEERYRNLGGYEFEQQAAAALHNLGLDATATPQRLSGGQQQKLWLARLLLSPAQLYLLDEPTNHLDNSGVAWLERWILNAKASFIVASHDRAFLDAVTDRTAMLGRGQLRMYPGSYSQARKVQATEQAAQERDYAAHQQRQAALVREKGRLQSAGQSAGRFNKKRAGNVATMAAKNKAQSVSNTLASRARAIERRAERLESQAPEKPFRNHPVARLNLPPPPVGPAQVLRTGALHIVRETFALRTPPLMVRRGEKLALTGDNGSGKSTLLAALLDELPAGGAVQWGKLTRFLLRQGSEELSALRTVGEALLDANPQLSSHQLYEVGASVQLPAPEHPVSQLSAGQRTRLSLARLSVTQAQLLILDEPTNYLDIEMVELLETLLLAYPGTLLLVSHDRHLVGRVAERHWHVEGGELRL